MAFFKGSVYSKILNLETGLCVILPHDRSHDEKEGSAKVLYLLHGFSDNCEAWTRYTSIERYAREYGLAVVMPEVQHGFYINMAHGLRYFDYVTKELPELCAKMFGISSKREDSYVAGLSMGGYGAMKCGLSFPEKYAGCASFSGVMDINIVIGSNVGEGKSELQGLFGMELKAAENDDLFHLAGKVSALSPSERPEIYISCGTEDFLYQSNIAFNERLNELEIPRKYMEWPGKHEWGFWDKSVRHALEYWFPDTRKKD